MNIHSETKLVTLYQSNTVGMITYLHGICCSVVIQLTKRFHTLLTILMKLYFINPCKLCFTRWPVGKEQATPSSNTDRFQNSVLSLANVPPHLKLVAALPCENINVRKLRYLFIALRYISLLSEKFSRQHKVSSWWSHNENSRLHFVWPVQRLWT